MIAFMPGSPSLLVLLFGFLALPSCSREEPTILVTIADARQHGAARADVGEPGDSNGDVLTFDQPLLDQQGNKIGNNSGTCIRTRVMHSFQCQWTLTLPGGTVQVAGREFDKAVSHIAVVGGTGQYSGIRGEMQSVNNGDGTFTQTLRFHLPEK